MTQRLPQRRRAGARFSVESFFDHTGQVSLHKFCRLSKYLFNLTPMGNLFAKQHHDLTCFPLPSCEAAGDNNSTFEIEELLPMALPPRPRCLLRSSGDRITSSRRRSRWARRDVAWRFAEQVVYICNAWHSTAAPVVAPSGSPNALQSAAFERLVARFVCFLRPFPTIALGTGRGNKTLLRMINDFTERWGSNLSTDDVVRDLRCVAQNVEAAKL